MIDFSSGFNKCLQTFATFPSLDFKRSQNSSVHKYKAAENNFPMIRNCFHFEIIIHREIFPHFQLSLLNRNQSATNGVFHYLSQSKSEFNLIHSNVFSLSPRYIFPFLSYSIWERQISSVFRGNFVYTIQMMPRSFFWLALSHRRFEAAVKRASPTGWSIFSLQDVAKVNPKAMPVKSSCLHN